MFFLQKMAEKCSTEQVIWYRLQSTVTIWQPLCAGFLILVITWAVYDKSIFISMIIKTRIDIIRKRNVLLCAEKQQKLCCSDYQGTFS